MIKTSIGMFSETQNISALNIEGFNVVDKLQICNELNKTFIVPVPQEILTYELPENSSNVTEFILTKAEEFEIYKIVSELAPKNSFGWDGMSVKILKQIILFIFKPLCHILNCSLKSGHFSANMKKTKIIPIYKKDDKINVTIDQ
jgi:hypothetical protein